jgi:DNA-binding transcriptional MocR family regulator
MSTQMQADASGGTIAGHGLDWPHLFATRAERMKASEIRELLKLLDQPDVISFAGGIPDPALFPAEAFGAALSAALSGDSAGARHCNTRSAKATSRFATGWSAGWPRSGSSARRKTS